MSSLLLVFNTWHELTGLDVSAACSVNLLKCNLDKYWNQMYVLIDSVPLFYP